MPLHQQAVFYVMSMKAQIERELILEYIQASFYSW